MFGGGTDGDRGSRGYYDRVPAGPDVEQMKDDLKHGISSLAGKLSRATASVMDTLQVCYCMVFISGFLSFFSNLTFHL